MAVGIDGTHVSPAFRVQEDSPVAKINFHSITTKKNLVLMKNKQLDSAW